MLDRIRLLIRRACVRPVVIVLGAMIIVMTPVALVIGLVGLAWRKAWHNACLIGDTMEEWRT